MPVVFTTGHRRVRKAGRIGVKALSYFLALSLGSMLIGLVVANIFKPGAGMNIDLGILDLPL